MSKMRVSLSYGNTRSVTATRPSRDIALSPQCSSSQSPKTRRAPILLAGIASCIVLISGALAATRLIVGPARVVDGDTLVVNGERIRLFGVDAPESAQPCLDARGASYACGIVSKDALAKKIGKANVTCNVTSIDLYGRSVSLCSLKTVNGSEDLNGWLVSTGYAVAYRQFSKAYVAAENQAQAAGKGIWQGHFQMPADWRKANKLDDNDSVQPPVPFPPSPAPPVLAPSPPSNAPSSNGGDPVPKCANGQWAIKGNIGSSGDKIYHVPGGRFYDSTRIDLKKGEKFFCTEAEAVAAGWRKSSQ